MPSRRSDLPGAVAYCHLPVPCLIFGGLSCASWRFAVIFHVAVLVGGVPPVVVLVRSLLCATSDSQASYAVDDGYGSLASLGSDIPRSVWWPSGWCVATLRTPGVCACLLCPFIGCAGFQLHCLLVGIMFVFLLLLQDNFASSLLGFFPTRHHWPHLFQPLPLVLTVFKVGVSCVGVSV